MRKYFAVETLGGAVILPRSITVWRKHARQALALLIATAILHLWATAFAAPALTPKANSNSSIGMLTVEGTVEVSGAPAVTGQTVFSGSNIRTSPGSESVLDLGNLAHLKLGGETSLTLESSKLAFSASLHKGVVRALVPAGVRADIQTAEAWITIDANQLAVFSVQSDSCSTTLSVQTGRVEMRAGGNVRSVSSGERFSTESGWPFQSAPRQSLSGGKKIGLFLGIGAAIAILLIAVTGGDQEKQPSGGCVIAPSGSTGGQPGFGC